MELSSSAVLSTIKIHIDGVRMARLSTSLSEGRLLLARWLRSEMTRRRG